MLQQQFQQHSLFLAAFRFEKDGCQTDLKRETVGKEIQPVLSWTMLPTNQCPRRRLNRLSQVIAVWSRWPAAREEEPFSNRTRCASCVWSGRATAPSCTATLDTGDTVTPAPSKSGRRTNCAPSVANLFKKSSKISTWKSLKLDCETRETHKHTND